MKKVQLFGYKSKSVSDLSAAAGFHAVANYREMPFVAFALSCLGIVFYNK